MDLPVSREFPFPRRPSISYRQPRLLNNCEKGVTLSRQGDICYHGHLKRHQTTLIGMLVIRLPRNGQGKMVENIVIATSIHHFPPYWASIPCSLIRRLSICKPVTTGTTVIGQCSRHATIAMPQPANIATCACRQAAESIVLFLASPTELHPIANAIQIVALSQ